MFLKSLSMKGFKSFADPTVLEFEPGITVVVGPNGSGKSNVVDAVTWVLGAQGPRSLRSAKMEDVIFAGTSSRPQLGRAEVSLTIDNSSGKLPVDLSEVTITRTLFRSGDSEYAINGAPCRLLDIQELLSDSGVGRQQHMIIGQGQLDTVLNARPEDRRAIIEEAAGVLKHRRRRERAERRLAATAENLERLGDLVRGGPAPDPSAGAPGRRRPLARCGRLRAAGGAPLPGRRGDGRADLPPPGRGPEPDACAATRSASCTPRSSGSTPRRPRRRPSSRRAGRRTWRTRLGRVQGLVERARGLQGVLRERGRAVLAALDAAADVDVVSTLEAEAARSGRPSCSTRPRPRTTAGGAPERAEIAAALAALDAEDAALRERWADVLGGEPDPEQAMARTQARRELITRAAAREQQDLDGLGERVASFEQRQAGAAVRADLLVRESEELDGATAALDAALAATTEELQKAARAAEAAQATADEATDARHRSEARAEALERALAELQGAGGRELLREVDGVVGSLVDLVEIDDGWEAAFEAAAGAGVAAVVVDGRRSAQAALTTLRERGVTGAVLAPRADGERTGRRTPPRRASRPAPAPSPCARTSAPARAVPSPSPCSTRSSAAPCASTAGRRPSTSRSPATTSSSSRPRATASPPRAGACATPPASSPRPRSKRRSGGPKKPPPRPSSPRPR